MNDFNSHVTSKDYASKAKRFANYIIDVLVFYVAIFVISIVVTLVMSFTGGDVDGFVDAADNVNPLLDRLLSMIMYAIYFMVVEGVLRGRSIGKYITKTKVVLKDGSTPTINETVIRSLCRIIPFEAFSFLGDEGKGWHDTLSKTFVVDIEKFETNRNVSSSIEQIGKPLEIDHNEKQF